METWLTYSCAVVVFVGVTLTLWSKIRQARENSRGWRTSIDTWGIRYEESIPKEAKLMSRGISQARMQGVLFGRQKKS